MHMMEITETKATAARVKADAVALAAAAKISDLDQEESPESIMLSSMNEEGAKGRTDREVVVPWLRFLWETYRAVLELLHKLPKLEKVYHKICEKAFKFCLDYNRTMEFRRLCDMLRMHLKNMQSSRNQKQAPWEWTSEIVEMHLQTRFHQLEAATTLELWNEAFRTVEDIHGITVAGRKTPKPKLLALFYEKLTRIFLVSGNQLFHAFAWYRYYTLTTEHRKDLKTDDKALYASYVLLSALSVASLKESEHEDPLLVDDDQLTERNQHIANLLDIQVHPSRKSLLSELFAKGLPTDVLPELTGLYEALESQALPEVMVKALAPALQFIKSHAQLNIYSAALQKVVVLRVVQQLGRHNTVVPLSTIKNLLEGVTDMSAIAIEKVIIDGVVRKELSLTLDHATSSVKFITTSTASIVDNQLSQLLIDLTKIKRTIELSNSTIVEKEKSNRLKFFAQITAEADEDNAAIQSRKNLIEQRKIEIERALEEKEKALMAQMSRDDARRQAEEEVRLEQERIKREDEKKRKLQDKEDILRVQKELQRLSVFKDEAQLAALEPAARQALVTEARQELVRAKEDEIRKIVEHARRLDHITRAIRIEAGEVVRKKYEAKLIEDKKLHEQEVDAIIADSKVQHAAQLDEKKRLQKMQGVRSQFEELLLRDQRAAYERKVQQLKAKALKEHRERKVAKARRLMFEEIERQQKEEEYERENQEKEERARVALEQYEALRRKREEDEAAEKAKEAEEDRLREERRLELEQKRQKMIEEKKKAALTQPTPVAAAATVPSTLPGEKEIVFRVPSSVAAATAQVGASSETVTSSAGCSTGGAAPWRPSGARSMAPSVTAAAPVAPVDDWK